MRRVRAIVRGRVQGVGFRAWCHGTASELALAGWVRNRRDGTVEALFAGPDAAVDIMLERLRAGPPGSAVSDVRTEPAPNDEALGGFAVRETV